MKKVMAFLMAFICFISFTGPVLASTRVQWQWRDTVTTAHPNYCQYLPNGNILVVRNGYAEPAVLEITPEKQTVWQYAPIQANSAVRLANGHTLITDSGAPGYPFIPGVIEVDKNKNVVWSYKFSSRAQAPRYADRLANGNTLIVTPQKVLEVTPAKEVVWSYSKDLINPVKAQRLENGHTLIVDRGYTGGKVLEVDAQGQVVWQYGDGKEGTDLGKLTGPTEALRRADGSTVIVDFDSARILELDKDNNIVDVTGWQDVLKSLPILNQWGVALGQDGHFYLSVSYTNGHSLLLKLNDKSLKIYVDGQFLYTSVQPMMVGGTTLAPARELFNALGATISWDNASKKLMVTKEGVEAEVVLGEKEALINGEPLELTVAPRMESGTVMVPVRFAAQALGAHLKWDNTNQTLILTTGQ